MVLFDTDDGVVCIGQAAHAWVSGELARRWGNDRIAVPEPFDEVCLGAEQHDVGMAEWDIRPELDPTTGLPRAFFQMPLETHLALWGAAPQKVLTQSPWAALIVSMHGRALYEGRDGDPARRYVAEQTVFQDELLDRLGASRDFADRIQKVIWTLDFLSLAPVTGWTPEEHLVPGPAGAPDVRIRTEGVERLVVSVDPWPFKAPEPFRLAYRGRLLPSPVETQEELDAAMRDAAWTAVTATWTPV
jgi:hypothetical protein